MCIIKMEYNTIFGLGVFFLQTKIIMKTLCTYNKVKIESLDNKKIWQGHVYI